jgi:replicative DNA helicase
MRLSAPIHQLKRSARILARKEHIPLHAALDRIAAQEGFAAWSLLVARAPTAPVTELFAQLSAGDLVLVGARPGHGKTLMSLKLAVEAMKAGRQSVFFSLEYAERDVLDRFRTIGVAPADFDGLFGFDSSDDISADYIIAVLADAPRGTLVVIDYLQLLDQKCGNPERGVQVRALQAFARRQGLIIVFISQIDRKYDPSAKPCPDLDDVRLPNPVDLSLFSKTCFLNNGEVQFQAERT